MSLDPVLNFSVVEVSTGYDDSATSIVLANGEGSKLPDPAVGGEYNLVWFDYTTYKNPADDPNVEIVRVTAISTDTLTVTRNQESSGASTKNTAAKTYKMILSLTKKTMDDLDTYMDKLDNIEASADVTDAINIASSIVGVDGKATPIDADTMAIIDSAAANVLKEVTWANVKATLKTYLDTLYAVIAHKTSHENGGGDEVSVAALSGLLADDQHVLDAEVQAVSINEISEDSTPQLGGTLDSNSKQVRFSKGADVASAGALTLGVDGNYFDITGTTSITSIVTLAIGTVVKLHFDGILTLTHQATDLILPSGANIDTAAGDEAEFIEYASGDWRCTCYTKASGEAVVSAGGGIDSGAIILWSGAISAIPDGHVICDGSNSTPNLSSKFVIHADADSGGTYDVGDNAATTTHTHGDGSYAGGNHQHSVPIANHIDFHCDYFGTGVAFTRDYYQPTNISSQSKTCGLTNSAGAAAVTGVSAAGGNLSPYHALAYIMKT